MKRRVFVSDVHMSTGDHSCDWLKPDQATMFGDFLDYVQADGDGKIDELILVGDMMDNWVWPIGEVPPPYCQIAAKQPNILDKLRAISTTKLVRYVIGNHDITITDNSISNFGNGDYPQIDFREFYESPDGVLAQHGHQFNMYNAWDPNNTLPIGHYISRLYATTKIRKRWQDEFAGGLEDALKGLENPYVNAPLSYLAGKLHIDDDQTIKTVEDGMITLKEVRELYADLPRRWVNSNGPLGPVESVLQETPEGLDLEAERKAKDSIKKVIIFGHTHLAKIRYVPSDMEKIAIYANCGSWCQDNAQYTYVVDEYDDVNGTHKVTLMYWAPRKVAFQASLTI